MQRCAVVVHFVHARGTHRILTGSVAHTTTYQGQTGRHGVRAEVGYGYGYGCDCDCSDGYGYGYGYRCDGQ